MGKQVVVISKTATKYGTPSPMDNKGTGVPGTPPGRAPNRAPSQTIIATGGGEGGITKDAEGQQAHDALAPQPVSHGSTGPIENGASVDYYSQQGNRIPAEVGTAQHRIIVGEQDQQLQDKAGA